MAKIQYYERVYTGHGEIVECFYEVPKQNGIWLAKNIGDKLPFGSDNPLYIAVFDSYIGVGYYTWSALLSLRQSPKKLLKCDNNLYYGIAEQSSSINPYIKLWISFNTRFIFYNTYNNHKTNAIQPIDR